MYIHKTALITLVASLAMFCLHAFTQVMWLRPGLPWGFKQKGWATGKETLSGPPGSTVQFNIQPNSDRQLFSDQGRQGVQVKERDQWQESTFTKYLYARYCAKHFTSTISLNTNNLHSSKCYYYFHVIWGNWGLQRLRFHSQLEVNRQFKLQYAWSEYFTQSPYIISQMG